VTAGYRRSLGFLLVAGLTLLTADCSASGQTSAITSPSGVTQPKADPSGVVWLCRPGQIDDPCLASLDTTVVEPDGSRKVVDYQAASNPPIDCFYAYPNITLQTTDNANLQIDPQEVAIAQIEASPFTQDCRIFAPMYREATGRASTAVEANAASSVAYRSVLVAWNDYLAHYNGGRGVVLIGHSEGSNVLTQLLVQRIDRVPAVRRLLVSAILTGIDDVSYKEGFGPLTTIGPCQSAVQTGCVVDYNAYAGAPPDGAKFGGPNPPDINGHAVQVICTNPANLSGGSGPLISLYRLELPTEEVAGSVSQGVLAGSPPKATTPWIEYDGGYSASCVTQNGYHVLRVAATGKVPRLSSKNAAWGLHVDDPNLAMGNLVQLVHSETRSYLLAPSTG
jgi:hypothetical protein